MEKVIIDTIQQYNLFDAHKTLVVAVSGGADSMMLLYVLSKLGYKLIVAHVNHQKREDAYLDQELVRSAAAALGHPFYAYDLPPAPTGVNFQAYARQKRYQFFWEVAKSQGTRYILTAHHGDDHVETVIHRLLHHQSASGLQGILPTSEFEGFKLTRPLINLSKADIYNYCRQKGVPYREDSSNGSPDYGRNRIRHRITPLLYEESPQLLSHTRKLSDGIAEDEAYFQQEVQKLWGQLQIGEGTVTLSRSWIFQLPRPLSKRLIKEILVFLKIDFSHEHILEVLRRIGHRNPNEQYYLPNGCQLVLAYDSAQFLTNPPKREPYAMDLPINGIITLPNECQLVINYKKDLGNHRKTCINEVYLCYNEIDLPLRVRTRKNGDRIDLIGGGTKKIKEIMIEAKIPKQLRDQWPVLTDASDRIIWLPLLKKSGSCRNVLGSNMIILEYRHHGGS